MNWLVIEGVKPWDGRYEFDLDRQELTTREWGFIKRYSGYLPTTLEEGIEGADPEFFCVVAVIALRRAGRIGNADVQQTFDRFADAPFGTTIRLEGDDEPAPEADADPSASSSSKPNGSGDGSRTSSETSPVIPPASGIPASATSTSARPASVR
jgi:hypothetical protein